MTFYYWNTFLQINPKNYCVSVILGRKSMIFWSREEEIKGPGNKSKVMELYTPLSFSWISFTKELSFLPAEFKKYSNYALCAKCNILPVSNGQRRSSLTWNPHLDLQVFAVASYRDWFTRLCCNCHVGSKTRYSFVQIFLCRRNT